MPATTAEDKNESSPVQGDDPGVVCFPCNPCGRVRSGEGDWGVAVVVDPGVVAKNTQMKIHNYTTTLCGNQNTQKYIITQPPRVVAKIHKNT